MRVVDQLIGTTQRRERDSRALEPLAELDARVPPHLLGDAPGQPRARRHPPGVVGQALPLPFIAIVTDAGHNRLGNIPVTFTVHNAVATNPGDFIFVTGNTVELGNWGTSFQTAIGPMLDPSYPDWFLNVSLPAGKAVEFKFIVIRADGSVVWENGANHTFAVPTAGTGSVNVAWQQ